jgi:hypothetical protein
MAVNGFSQIPDNGFITFLGVNRLHIERFNPYPDIQALS